MVSDTVSGRPDESARRRSAPGAVCPWQNPSAFDIRTVVDQGGAHIDRPFEGRTRARRRQGQGPVRGRGSGYSRADRTAEITSTGQGGRRAGDRGQEERGRSKRQEGACRGQSEGRALVGVAHRSTRSRAPQLRRATQSHRADRITVSGRRGRRRSRYPRLPAAAAASL